MTDVLTLRMDGESQAHFEALRQRHFPPERNHIPAHLTLFHTLPGEAWVGQSLATAADATRPFAMQVTGVRSLGKGVAYALRSPELESLHTELVDAFQEVLTPQDRQRLRPHVVVQNKVPPEAAKALLRELEAEFQTRSVRAAGLDLWHYLGGPWQLAQFFPFARTAA